MATRKKDPLMYVNTPTGESGYALVPDDLAGAATVLREGSDAPQGEFVSEVHACKIVSFRQHDGLLETDGAIVGDILSQGRYSGAKVVGIYVTQHGCVIELDHAGQARAILHTGDYAAELADA